MRLYLQFLVLTILGGLAFVSRAEAVAAPVAVVQCQGCLSQADLQTEALNYAEAWMGQTPPGYEGVISPPATPSEGCSEGVNGGTTFIVVSNAAPISGDFYVCLQFTYYYGYPIGVMTAIPIDATTNADTITYDDRIIARSAETGIIRTPTGIPVTETPETISAWLSSAAGVPQVGPSEIDLWHGLTNFPQAVEGKFIVSATGQQFTLWNSDTITVTDQNGWTAKFQWTPLSNIQWKLVPGSIRDQNGNPPTANEQEPNPGTPLAPAQYALVAAGLTISYPGGPTVFIFPFFYPTAIVTVQQLYNDIPPAQLCVDLEGSTACASNPP
jgi:hypothetical protein